MDTASQFIISRQDAKILQAAKELCSMYEGRFSSAASRNTSTVVVYSLAKTAQAFSAANSAMSTALITAKIHAEQDALNDDN